MIFKQRRCSYTTLCPSRTFSSSVKGSFFINEAFYMIFDQILKVCIYFLAHVLVLIFPWNWRLFYNLVIFWHLNQNAAFDRTPTLIKLFKLHLPIWKQYIFLISFLSSRLPVSCLLVVVLWPALCSLPVHVWGIVFLVRIISSPPPLRHD